MPLVATAPVCPTDVVLRVASVGRRSAEQTISLRSGPLLRVAGPIRPSSGPALEAESTPNILIESHNAVPQSPSDPRHTRRCDAPVGG